MNNKLAIALTTSVCICCGKQHQDNPEILIDRRFCDEDTKEKRVKEMSKPSSYKDCNQCTDYKTKGVILLGFDESKSDMTNFPSGAYRTGEFLVVKPKVVSMFTKDKNIIKNAKEKRMLFIPTELAQQLIKSYEDN